MHPELEHYLVMIHDLRQQARDQIADLPADALNWRPLAATQHHSINSLAVLASHLVGAEHFWIAEVIAGQPPTRQRNLEFETVVSSVDPILARMDEVAAETATIFTGLEPGVLEETRQVQGREVTVRWSMLHVIDHSALHLGHMQITYQLWSEGGRKPSPRWYERVPS